MTLLLLFNPEHDYPRVLLRQAKELEEKQPAIAVVVAQMAVEVTVERAFSNLLRRENLGRLGDVFEVLIPDRSMMDRRTRDVFEALTGERVSQHASWKPYHSHVERRNRLVHSESHATTAEAHESIEAVERFVEHVDAAAHRTIDGGGG